MRSTLVRLSALTTLPLISSCHAIALGALHAAGPVAEAQRHLYFMLAIVLVFVAGPVLLLTPLIAWHYRLSNKDNAFQTKWHFSWWLEGLIWVPPTGIVIGLSVLLWDYTHRLDPYRPIAGAQPPLEIQAIALDWKWLFIYPDQHIASVNQLAIPVGRPVRISLTSGTVMQAMLIPRLAGQIYAMAGMRTQLNLAASAPGIYRGANVQYNGTGFARQKFAVIALPPAGYRRWLDRVHAADHPLDQAAFARLFARSTPPQPIFYSTVPAGLFDTILSRDASSMEMKR
ncbi:MAG: cytochrome ubiquinol oxidase subunit II [Sphingomonas sp. 28-66-16]|nr:MAG: cytochrome ubiquinol oxidase subunit II [Sphingomonas sp. 28-66-16]